MIKGAEVIARQLNIQPGENITIVVDEGTDERVGTILLEQALSVGADATLTRVRGRTMNGENLPPQVVAALRVSDVAILSTTTWSASHSAGVISAIEGGLRVLSMPGVTYDMFLEGAMTADYDEVERQSIVWGERFARGHQIRITTARGTDLTAGLGGWGRAPFLDIGKPPATGGLCNIPGGEVALAPIEGTASGVVVADIMLSTSKGSLTEPVELTIVDGVVTRVKGGQAAREFEAALERHGDSARVVAEVAIGTNAASRFVGVVIEDEKKLGTAHVGFGHAVGLGGKNASTMHADAIVDHATLSIDGVLLIKDGVVMPEGEAREAIGDFAGQGGRYRTTGAATRRADGYLERSWRDIAGETRWMRVGDDAAARLLADLDKTPLTAEAGTDQARQLELLALYGLVEPEA